MSYSPSKGTITALQPFLDKKDSSQITSHIYLETRDNQLICKATDFEMGLCSMTIFGAGSLSVKGTYADGISSDDGLLLKSGVVTVSAADDAVRGKDYLIVEGGTVSAIGKTGHGLKSDNEDSGAGLQYGDDRA
jgi:hypothetical protein